MLTSAPEAEIPQPWQNRPLDFARGRVGHPLPSSYSGTDAWGLLAKIALSMGAVIPARYDSFRGRDLHNMRGTARVVNGTEDHVHMWVTLTTDRGAPTVKYRMGARPQLSASKKSARCRALC